MPVARSQKIYGLVLTAFLSLLVLVAADIPRFLAFGPAIAGIIGFGLLYRVSDNKPVFAKAAFVTVFGILALGALSFFWAIDPAEVLRRVPRLALIMIPGAFLISTAINVKPEWIRGTLWLFPAAVMAAALLICIDLFFDAPVHRLLRMDNSLQDVRDHVFNRGAVTAVIFFFPALATLRNHMDFAPALLLLTAVFIPLLTLAESQSAQLSLFTGLMFMSVFPYRIKAAWKLLGAAVIIYILIVPFIAIWAFNSFAATANALPWFGAGSGYAGARLELWDYVSRYALQNPLFGYGIEASRTITDFDSAQIYQPGTSILHPHNFALQLWLEFGLVGAAAGAAFCRYILWIIEKSLTIEQARMILPCFMAILCAASTSYGLWQSWWVGSFFLFAAMCILTAKIIKPEIINDEKNG